MEGSLRQCLRENISAYTKHMKRVNEFLAQDISARRMVAVSAMFTLGRCLRY